MKTWRCISCFGRTRSNLRSKLFFYKSITVIRSPWNREQEMPDAFPKHNEHKKAVDYLWILTYLSASFRHTRHLFSTQTSINHRHSAQLGVWEDNLVIAHVRGNILHNVPWLEFFELRICCCPKLLPLIWYVIFIIWPACPFSQKHNCPTVDNH